MALDITVARADIIEGSNAQHCFLSKRKSIWSHHELPQTTNHFSMPHKRARNNVDSRDLLRLARNEQQQGRTKQLSDAAANEYEEDIKAQMYSAEVGACEHIPEVEQD